MLLDLFQQPGLLAQFFHRGIARGSLSLGAPDRLFGDPLGVCLRFPSCNHEWQDGHGKPGGRAEAARRLEEAHRLLEEVADMLTDVRRDLLGGR